MRSLRSFPLYLLVGLLFWVTAAMAPKASAQSSTAAARITSAVDESSLTTLKGNTSRLAQSKYDQGEADSSTQLTHMRLVLSRTTDQQTSLNSYLSQLQSKSSSNYHKWLTPSEFGSLYGPADSDISTIESWLESKGLTVESVPAGRTTIDFSGSVSQVEAAFHTSIHSYSVNETQFYSNSSDPSIPSALATVVSGVAHLNTIKPTPHFTRASVGKMNTTTKRLETVSTSSSTGTKANLTGTSNGAYILYIVPADAATIYDTPNTTLNANYTSGTTYDGTGVIIGVGGDASINASTAKAYGTQFLPSAQAPTLQYCSSSSSCSTSAGSGYYSSTSGDGDEAYIDTELSQGLAPGASIYYYASTDLTTGMEAAINLNVVDIFSLSFGECELDMSTSDNATFNSLWEQAAAQGIAVTVSTGDSGSAGCDSTSDSNGNNVTAATGGLAVNGLASTPYNIAVGGTDFYELPNNYSTYASTSDGSSSTYYRTAKSYIPESTWNDSTYNNTTISEDETWSGAGYTSSDNNIVAGSGGVSSCSTNTSSSSKTGSCTHGYSKPSWQTATSGTLSSGSYRYLPDVSLMAGNGYDDSAWVVCDDYTSGGDTANCESSSSGFYFDAYGGTSTSAPAFAGILALVEQSQGGRLGQAAANLYNLYNNGYSSVFHDTTVGNNAVPCTSGTSNCSKDSAGYYYETGYNTSTGYDEATGLGSVDAKLLINDWSHGTGSATATVTVTPGDSSINVADTLSVGIAVTGSSSTPSGSVTLTSGSYTSSTVSLDNDEATIIIPANSLSASSSGTTDTLTVTYSGDGVYASNTGTATVTVYNTSTTSTTTSLSTSSTAPTFGTSVTLTASVSPTAATGTVYFYDSFNKSYIGTGTLSSGSTTYSTSSLAVGTHTITATYEGNSTYASSTSSSVTVTVSSSSSNSSCSGTSCFTLSSSNLTVSQGSSGSETITITSENSYAGTVDFKLYASSTSSLTNYGCYSINSTAVTANSTATTTLTLYTASSSCTTASSAKSAARHTFAKSSTKSISSNGNPASNKVIPISFAALAGFMLLGLRRRQTKWWITLGCFVCLGMLGLAVGCSSSSSSSSKDVAKGSYTVELEGTDSSSSNTYATTTFTLTVD